MIAAAAMSGCGSVQAAKVTTTTLAKPSPGRDVRNACAVFDAVLKSGSENYQRAELFGVFSRDADVVQAAKDFETVYNDDNANGGTVTEQQLFGPEQEYADACDALGLGPGD